MIQLLFCSSIACSTNMAAASVKSLKIAFIPGTGKMGSLIALHLSKAGLDVFIGSRNSNKAAQQAELISSVSKRPVQGGSNPEAAAWGDVVFWSPSGPLEEREALLKSLAPNLENKIIVDVTNILYFFDNSQWGQTSSTLRNEKALGVPARWTTAFKSTYERLLKEPPNLNNPHHTFVVGDDEEAVATTIAVVDSIPGFKGVRAGGLQNSKLVELLGPRWIMELDTLNGGGQHLSGWRYGF
eukprot:c28321_g1_i2 orf=453-1175(-)